MLKRLLSFLPLITVGMDDWHLHVSVGERQLGFTVGPRFLSLDKGGDIAVQVVSPGTYRSPMSDVCFDWNSKDGWMYVNIPGVNLRNHAPVPTFTPVEEISRHQDEDEWDVPAVRQNDALYEHVRDHGTPDVGGCPEHADNGCDCDEDEPLTVREPRGSNPPLTYAN
jgi:hypothetical protein